MSGPSIAHPASVLATLLLLCVQSTGAQPTKAQLQQALTARLPPNVRLLTFAVQATENIGNKVDPNWHARISATARMPATTYARDATMCGLRFVRVVRRINETVPLFVKTMSTLRQGQWIIDVSIEGRPFSRDSLGQPLSSFGTDTFIVRGSAEDIAFRGDVRRAQAPTQQLGRFDGSVLFKHGNGVIVLSDVGWDFSGASKELSTFFWHFSNWNGIEDTLSRADHPAGGSDARFEVRWGNDNYNIADFWFKDREQRDLFFEKLSTALERWRARNPRCALRPLRVVR